MFGGNLGVALGAAADEFNNQRRMAREDSREKREVEQFGMQKEQFGWQREEEKRKAEVDRQQKEAADFYNNGLVAIEKGDFGSFAPQAVDYLNRTDFRGKARGAYLQGADGKHYITYSDVNGPPETLEINQDMARNALREMYQHRMAAADPRRGFEHMNSMENLGLKRQEVAAAARKAAAAEQENTLKYGPGGFYGAGGAWERASAADNAAKLEAARIAAGARSSGGGGPRNHFVPLTGGYMFDQAGGGYYDAAGKRITDNALIEKINKMGTPLKAAPEIPKEVVAKYAENYMNLSPKERDALKLSMPEVHAAAFGGSTELKVGRMAGGEGAVGGAQLSAGGNFVRTPTTNITRPAAAATYVAHPVTGEPILREEYDRLVGENQTLVGRGLRMLGVR